MTTKALNLIIIIGTITAFVILGTPLMAFAEYSPWAYYPGRYDWIRQILASNPNIALGALIVLIAGILSTIGYTVYKIFFKYKNYS